MATTPETPPVTDRQYNATDNNDGGLNRVVVDPKDEDSSPSAPTAESVPHVAEVPQPRNIPILNDREGKGQKQEAKVSTE